MALTERTRPYETLIRHNADGSVGAQHQRISEILNDTTVIAATVQAPIDITSATAEGPDLVTILGEATSSALTDNERLRGEASALESRVATLIQQLETATSQVDGLREQIAKLTDAAARAA
ncbi:hypothetical protein [Burkholderia cepacia]|uniref:hypothetical protein n=1 Tax=Burkholderia cepacia TaxID=292 RepID=UPI0007C6652F|nr:hypothetical protein [Burkholderia cepacia]